MTRGTDKRERREGLQRRRKLGCNGNVYYLDCEDDFMGGNTCQTHQVIPFKYSVYFILVIPQQSCLKNTHSDFWTKMDLHSSTFFIVLLNN